MDSSSASSAAAGSQALICLVSLVLCVVFGFIGTEINRGKGRSKGTGFLVGFLFGLIGIIILALLSKDEAGLRRQQLESGISKECPFCRSVIPSQAVLCPNCRSELIKPVAGR